MRILKQKANRKNEGAPMSRKAWKRRIYSALSLLLISTILLTAATYAWLVLSTRPEVSGITTQVGANGSLEIALLNSTTYADMTKISSAVGDSRVTTGDSTVSNITWGNLVDVSSTKYGLDQVKLYPSRLSVSSSNMVNTLTPLMSPTYGADGRVASVTADTVTGVYDLTKSSFTCNVEDQGYGVRCIGKSTNLNAQQTAMRAATSSIKSGISSVNSTMKTAMTNDGGIIAGFISSSTETASAEQYEAIADLSAKTLASLTNIDSCLRMAVIAKLSTVSSLDETAFTAAKQIVENAAYTYDVCADYTLGEDFTGYCSEIKTAIVDATANNDTIVGLATDKTTALLKPCINKIMNASSLTINGYTLSTATDHQDELLAALTNGTGLVVTVPSGSGYTSMIADYVGSYSATTVLKGGSLPTVESTIEVNTALGTPKLTAVQTTVSGMSAVSTTTGVAEITDTYGYALDLAFKTNVQSSNLLLQTKGAQRVYSDSSSGGTLGSGSTMKFYASELDYDQTLDLMNAMRVGFVDCQGNLLAVAKADIANASIDAEGFNVADLYLFDYTIDSENKLVIDDNTAPREDASITSLTQNVAISITAIVWLDGDLVDNTMVSATTANSLEGYLNLQFASSSDLIPAVNNQLKGVEMDKKDLLDNVDDEAIKAKYNLAAKDNQYTKESYERFRTAYETALEVSTDTDATAAEVTNANIDLTYANSNLKNNDLDQLKADIQAAADDYGLSASQGTYTLYSNEGQTTFYFKLNDTAWFDAKDMKKETINEVETLTSAAIGDRVLLADSTISELTEYSYSDKDGAHKITKTTYVIDAISIAEVSGKYLTTYSEETRTAYENALCDAQEYVANYKYESEDKLEARIDALENAKEALLNSADVVSYHPYVYNDSTFYLGTDTDNNTAWYSLDTEGVYHKVTSQKTIRKLYDKAQKVALTEYKQLLHKSGDDVITNLTNYYYGSDGNWYKQVDKLVAVTNPEVSGSESAVKLYNYFVRKESSVNNFIVPTAEKLEKDKPALTFKTKVAADGKIEDENITDFDYDDYKYLGLDSCAAAPVAGENEVYAYVAKVSTSYVRIDDSTLVSSLKSAKGTLKINADTKTMLDTDELGTYLTYNLQSTTEVVAKDSETDMYATWSVNSTAVVITPDEDGDTCNVNPVGGKSGTATVSVTVTSENGNDYTASIDITIVHLTEHKLDGTSYYYGSNGNWYSAEDLTTQVTNKDTIAALNALL